MKGSILLQKLRKKSEKSEQSRHTAIAASQHSAWLLPKDPQRSFRKAECKAFGQNFQNFPHSEPNQALLSPRARGGDSQLDERGWQLHSNYIGPAGDIQPIPGPASTREALDFGGAMRGDFASRQAKGASTPPDWQRSTTQVTDSAAGAGPAGHGLLESDSETDSGEWDVVDLTANQMRESVIYGQAESPPSSSSPNGRSGGRRAQARSRPDW